MTETPWLDWLRAQPYAGDLTFRSAASDDALKRVEAATETEIPSELRSLLLESDGIVGEHGLGVIWETERLREDNLRFRTELQEHYDSFRDLLFFADAGNGDQFAYRLGRHAGAAVWVWDHEDDRRTLVAPNLRSYLDTWLSGSLAI